MTLEQKIQYAMCGDRRVLAIGYLRYEALRKLAPVQFARIYSEDLRFQKPFNDFVDELIEKDAK